MEHIIKQLEGERAKHLAAVKAIDNAIEHLRKTEGAEPATRKGRPKGSKNKTKDASTDDNFDARVAELKELKVGELYT